MRITIENIADRGIANRERIVISVSENSELHFYIVADTISASAGMISTKLKHVFWFPRLSVSKGDTIFLFTGQGKQNSVARDNGSQAHFFYWGLSQTIWNNVNDRAVLFEINSWQTDKQ